MTFPILASLLVRLVVLLPFQLLRLSLATPSRWTPLALSVFLHGVGAVLVTLLEASLLLRPRGVAAAARGGRRPRSTVLLPLRARPAAPRATASAPLPSARRAR